ncbi:hypothetical protein SAMN05216229_11260 [Geopseudomonas sagittaria]|uniref:Sel1 repeat-containing protein n=1 Tax=Geopseudomonas sagittaria TaxID=1135990 RepID=A0A1I5W2X0_9GAMM|nr:tetratricopeptide repeat protein [Pseudomonas sagittaria]SFQ13947.1 hypothetical protein SAMN05216229_11260 [Pseudomonas sagittaria]
MKHYSKVIGAALTCTCLVFLSGCNGLNKESELHADALLAAKIEQAESESMYQRGLDYLEGRNGSERSSAKAVHWLEQAADRGHIQAQMALAEFYRLTDGKQYVYWMQRAAERGSTEAQLLLAHAYGRGEVLKTPKYATAFYWYNKAALNGNKNALYWLGWSYLKGEGIPVDIELAKYWFRRSSDPRAAKELAKLK